MLLAIDCGNSNTKFAILDGDGRVSAKWSIRTCLRRTSDEYIGWLLQLMLRAGIGCEDVSGVVVSSVVPDVNSSLCALSHDLFNIEPLLIENVTNVVGLPVRVERPGDVGADRLITAVAGIEALGAPLIVVDFGTATTFDYISQDGAFCGGVIVPGVKLGLDALRSGTAKLPSIVIRRPSRVIGRSTVESIEAGIFWGYVAVIEGVVTRMRTEIMNEYGAVDQRTALDSKLPPVIATGGLAKLFSEVTDVFSSVDENLAFRGLFLMYRRRVG